MSKIIGNTTATPVPRSDWNQTDKKRPDYIRNKPKLGAISEKDVIDKTDLNTDIQSSLEEIDALESDFKSLQDEVVQKSQVQIITWESDD